MTVELIRAELQRPCLQPCKHLQVRIIDCAIFNHKMSQTEAQVWQTSLGRTALWILVISLMFLTCTGFAGEVSGAFNTWLVNFINNKQQPSFEASWQALQDTPISPRASEEAVTGGSIQHSPGLTYTTNNNRILTNGWESSAKCMQMSFFLVIYCQDHLWKVGAISIFYLKEAAANTQVSHCNGTWWRFEENFVILMPGFVEAPPQCPRFVPVCCAACYLKTGTFPFPTYVFCSA